jgi:ATP-dependent Clp protease ATP-binding subunit ClpA
MFDTLRKRFQDMKTVSALCSGADKHAQACGQKEPGAEHFILAALELPDGTARKVFEQLQISPQDFKAAIGRQYADALRNVGIDIHDDSIFNIGTPVKSEATIYHAKPSGQALMQILADQKTFSSKEPLLGAHVLLAATDFQYGTVGRTFHVLGISNDSLAAAAKKEIEAACHV